MAAMTAEKPKSYLAPPPLHAGLLVLLALLFCASALMAPFWGDHDTWSNLLPIIQYRRSILDEHTLPVYTTLWYGGRYQWMNPLWNFLYLPATIVWLLLPLDWGTRIVLLGHLIFALFAGRGLASLFLKGEVEKTSAAIILVSPMLSAMWPGHIEKILGWGWVLLTLYYVFHDGLSLRRRGMGAGVCLGILALTGANYYVLYTGIVVALLLLSYKSWKLFSYFTLGSLVGVLHLPSVFYLIGVPRGNAAQYIPLYSTDFWGMVASLAIGIGKPFIWESWMPVGLPMLFLFLLVFYREGRTLIHKQPSGHLPQKVALLASIVLLGLLASGVLYKGHHILDTFRAPVRALAFAALGIVLFVLLGYSSSGLSVSSRQHVLYRRLLFLSALQVGLTSWVIRPPGALHGPYDSQAQEMARILISDNAHSVWFSMQSLRDMYIHAVLMQNGLALPNVSYGDMGQSIPVRGAVCGYSFDHLVTLPPRHGETRLELKSDLEYISALGDIPMERLQLLSQISVHEQTYNIYRVVCAP